MRIEEPLFWLLYQMGVIEKSTEKNSVKQIAPRPTKTRAGMK